MNVICHENEDLNTIAENIIIGLLELPGIAVKNPKPAAQIGKLIVLQIYITPVNFTWQSASVVHRFL